MCLFYEISPLPFQQTSCIIGKVICRCVGIGRRGGLKIHCQRWRAGSSPATGTKAIKSEPFPIEKGSDFIVIYKKMGDYMRCLSLSVYVSGMNEETYTEEIMIYKPFYDFTISFTVQELNRLNLFCVGELVTYIKNTYETLKQKLGIYGMVHFDYESTYIKVDSYLLGLQHDKTLSEIFEYFNTETLEFVHFFVAGGASIHNETQYRFTVHSDEKIHENMPHVHVKKSGVDIRYSLETLEAIDPLVYPHKRDKKIILRFLKSHINLLREMWNHNINGYTTPTLSEDDKQYYKES